MTERRRSPGGALARLGVRAADYAWAADRQLRHLVRRPALPAAPAAERGATGDRSGGRAPVVLLPGIYETWEFLGPVATALARAGHPVHAVPGLGYNARPVPEAADRVVEHLERTGLCDAVLVAHSKGGLIGKRVLLSAASDQVLGMVAIATPFTGSRWARYMVSRALRSFDPRDPVLLALAGELLVNERITAVYPHFDPHIPETGHLAGARNVELPLSGHFRPLGHPLLVDTVVREVARVEAEHPVT
ncbi:esterase/lipase family protein [Promicromonospora iranensis]|uniref:Pimeloyl-ACP methyl ester carboxylesterase n=1 Tax=Promicromonospora iranensis TaxID=1105144 RepID=A0ABU2CWF9_9MICO|nr:alpha/beta fold hydrolase [Promicromonospora iranensis]MDR7385672.1 pimeloyl-ACP methyl ester carboxylesterase [Promicromonospora iranensis]